jgi:hypothetical protein
VTLTAPVFTRVKNLQKVRGNLEHVMSHKLDVNCRKCWQNFIYACKLSIAFTSPIFPTLALARPIISVKNSYPEFLVFSTAFHSPISGSRQWKRRHFLWKVFVMCFLQKVQYVNEILLSIVTFSTRKLQRRVCNS